ncbi:alpha/beta hydrolase [Dyella choica]|uniref:Alpha/beta hydrolase n=1 Tax=Dyella choica TaxID=1927959 RepID=A0A3S0PPW5_9GAMM|nr:alpha/beta hydrolase-fold protein [Dyella choica]RUL79005.1 alpha/beta hydrolase [Dyella choica]
MELLEFSPPFTASLPFTRYFELDSKYTGARHAVWVTTPASYTVHPDADFPAIYVLDGNVSVPQTAVFHLLEFDPIHPIEAFLHVGVGYVGEDARRQLAVRARDLIPPGEPLPPGASEAAMSALVEQGMLDQAGLELYLQYLKHPAADRFLAFLTKELHPQLTRRYRIKARTAGLFGYSYAGLFSIYAALDRSELFQRIGAGSPAIRSGTSRVFEQYEAQWRAQADHSGRRLHLTVCESELSADSYYRNLVGLGAGEFISLASGKPLHGLLFSSRVIEHESHATALAPSWYSFLRNCFPAERAGAP